MQKNLSYIVRCTEASSALTLLVGRQEVHPVCKNLVWWGAGVVICLERGAELHMAQLMPLPLTVSCFSKVQIFWYRLTWVVPEKGPLNLCSCRLYCCVLSAGAVKTSGSATGLQDRDPRTTSLLVVGAEMYYQCRVCTL